MHGVKKTIKTQEEKDATAKRIQKYRNLMSKALQLRSVPEKHNQLFELTTKLIGINPDAYPLWNIRREIFLSKFPSQYKDKTINKETEADIENDAHTNANANTHTNTESETDVAHTNSNRDTHTETSNVHSSKTLEQPAQDVKEEMDENTKLDDSDTNQSCSIANNRKDQERKAIAAEFSLTQYAISEKNPKCYYAWYQRKWLVLHYPEFVNFQREIDLCNQLLVGDERNFHCWNYRRFIIEQGNLSKEVELEYTTNKIHANFSNYSAWHYRTYLLPSLYGETISKEHSLVHLPLTIIQNEQELIRQAVFTEPDDQSAWIYHRWLISQLVLSFIVNASNNQETENQSSETLSNILTIFVDEIKYLVELHELEPQSKWTILAISMLTRIHGIFDIIYEQKMETSTEIHQFYPSMSFAQWVLKHINEASTNQKQKIMDKNETSMKYLNLLRTLDVAHKQFFAYLSVNDISTICQRAFTSLPHYHTPLLS